MTCGELHVQSWSLLWSLSMLHLVYNTIPEVANAKQTVSNLIIQRSRVVGGTITIPIDSTVKLVKCSRREEMHHTIRLRYGTSDARKCLAMRASSSREYKQWLAAIGEAIAASKEAAKVVPAPGSSKSTILPNVFAVPVHRHEDNSILPPGSVRYAGKKNTPSPAKLTTKMPQTRSPKCSLRQTIPAVMQFFIAVGQVIASAS